MSGSGRKLLLEGLVVVVSILIAFGLDAAWDSAELRRDLRSDLDNVARELEVNRSRVAFHVDMAVRIGSALEDLGNSLASTDASHVAVPDTVAWLVGIYPSLDASLGAVDALIASGRMAAIKDPELARRLAGLRDVIDDVVEDQLAARETFNRHLVPFIGEVKRSTSHIADAFWVGERVPGRALTSRSDVAYPNNAVVRGAVAQNRGTYVVLIGELRALSEELALIVALAEEQV